MPGPNPTYELAKQVRDAINLAGGFAHLNIHPTAASEFYVTILTLLGGSLDNADAFVAQVPDVSSNSHRVWWLQGVSFGSLELQAPAGPAGENVPAVVRGWVHSIRDVARVEVLGAKGDWPFSGDLPTIELDVSIHLPAEVVTIRTSERNNESARNQASVFIATALAALAGRGTEEA